MAHPPPSISDQAALLREVADYFDLGASLAIRLRQCHLPVPDRLSALLSEEPDQRNGHVERGLALPPMSPPPAPASIQPDWIWVAARAAAPKALALGILRQAGGPLTAKQIHDRLSQYRETSSGVLANIGTALNRSAVIRRSEDGWQLMAESHAPVLHGDYLWGPPDLFSVQEQAWYRREAIKYLLGQLHDGLQTTQISKMLAACTWLRSPCEKDIIKMDMTALADAGSVRRVGRSRKWVLVGGAPSGGGT